MNIDWSKAPEGATHYRPQATMVFWYQYAAGTWKYFHEQTWKYSSLTPDTKYNLIKKPVDRGVELRDQGETLRKRVLADLVMLIETADANDKTMAEAIYDAGYRKP